ncbi:MAG: ImmA/IrrE family metallo-endopeptidase [Propionibacteriales bacterium]|nr:ImmA/IrrE family metallo-endopeptidase [Propionibacteriales bacterium]
MSTTTDWSNPLVERLVRRHRGKDPRQIIESFAAQCLEEAKQESLPINIDLIASLRGIRRRVADHPFAGRIYADAHGQLIMDLRADDPEVRQRFTCAHEITHTAFPGFAREARYRVDTAVGVNQNRRDEEEYLCDYGAAALLMPRQLIADEYTITAGLRDVERLARDADVSLEAAANRLIELADAPAVLLVFRWGHKPADRPALRRGEDVAERLRVRYCVSRNLRLFLPKYKSADNDSVFVQALESPRVQRSVEPLPGGSTPFRVQAKQYPWWDERRVIAVATPVVD